MRLHRRTTLLMLTAALASCGSDTVIPPIDDDDDDDVETFSISGSIAGHDADVTLSLNGVPQTFSSATFTFTQEVDDGAAYVVLFVSSASGQSCTVTNGIGVATAAVTDVTVSCEAVQPVLRYDDAEVTGNMASGDLDGDGAPDFVFTIRTLPGHAVGDNLDMYRLVFGSGDGAFSAPVDVSRVGSSDANERGRQFVIDDFDGDGVDDFAYSSASGLEVFSVGAGRAPQRFFGPETSDSPLAGIDADDNGTTDLISIVVGGSRLDFFNLYRSNGDGTFQPEESIANRNDAEAQALGMGSPVNMAAGDFDGDGVDDIAAVVQTGSGSDSGLDIALLSGDGAGGFTYPAALSPITDDIFEGYFPFEIASKELAVGDFDGDGDADLAMTSTTNFILLLENDGDGAFTESGRVTVRTRPIHVRLADFDDDGSLDLLVAHADSRDIVVSFGDGAGSFGGPADGDDAWRSFPLDPDADLYDVTVADLDDDGVLDVAVAENGTNPSNSGRGSIHIFFAPGG